MMSSRLNSRILMLLAVLLALAFAPARAHAGGMHFVAFEPIDFFGMLSQADTDCEDEGCGPTAAVNGFVYLQNQDPGVYHKLLVQNYPDVDPLGPESDVANLLLGYMNARFAMRPIRVAGRRGPISSTASSNISTPWRRGRPPTPLKPPLSGPA